MSSHVFVFYIFVLHKWMFYFNCLPCLHLVAYFTLILTHSFGFLCSFGFEGFILGAARPRQFRFLGAV